MILVVCPNPSVDTYAWVHSLAPGQVHRSLKEQRYPGGKGVHVALALAELKQNVTLLGIWGGPTGEWVKSECEKIGVKCEGLTIKDWTRSCTTFKSESEYDDTELLGAGPVINKDNFNQFIEIYDQLIIESDIVSMSGSWPFGAGEVAYAHMIQLAKAKKVKTFLDCTGIQLENALNENPFGLHLNIQEAKTIIKGKDSPKDIVNQLLKYAEMVALTAGKDGLYLGYRKSIIHGYVQLENVHSAVGSGDCLVAGLISEFLQYSGNAALAKKGVACGAANCLREDLGMFYESDVKILENKIEIKVIE